MSRIGDLKGSQMIMSTISIQVDKDEIRRLFHELSRKLLLLEGERKAVKRREIINSMLDEDGCEIERLKELLSISG